MTSSLLSDLLGWISIGCWLGAQFPQVLENIRRQSCEGLALPFLFNWLLGDFTNLIGCILTHQLPFQTILAAYFVSVDFMLFSQYFYYRRASTAKLETAGSIPSSPVQRYGSHARRISTEYEQGHHYRELSSAAVDVAIAAAFAAASNSEEELRTRGHEHALTKDEYSKQRSAHRRSSTSITRSEAEEAEDEVDEDALAALADSFQSDSGRKRVSWSQERLATIGRGGSTSQTRSGGRIAVAPLTPVYTASSTGVTDNTAGSLSARGRPLQRQIQIVESPIEINDLEGNEVSRQPLSGSDVRTRRNSRASQRSARLVFLGVWALFGIGTLSQRGRTVTPSSHSVVLSETPLPVPIYPSLTLDYPTKYLEEISPSAHVPEQAAIREPQEFSSERIIGRVFAWACTTLYLTSRLPQIWKNYVRKSVEGLSMYLFVFAFLGNTFYVLSILSSPMMSKPRPISTAFLLESMPYLLGSGGTLLFDVTIVSQSFLYRKRLGHHHQHSHSHHQHASHYHHHHHHQSSHSRSRANSYNPTYPAQKSFSSYGSIDYPHSAPEEERALLRSAPAITRADSDLSV